jgi:hypothetical protein
MFNGNLSCYAIGFDKKLQSFNKQGTTFNRLIPELAKYIMLIQNLVVRRQTLNTPHEVIDSVFKR